MVEFQSRVSDFIQLSYDEHGGPVFEDIVSRVIDCLDRYETTSPELYVNIDPLLYFVVGLAETIADHEGEDHELQRLFIKLLESGMFDSSLSTTPPSVRQRLLLVVGDYSDFFARHEEFIPMAFKGIASSVEDPMSTAAAANATFRLCDSGREVLIAHMNELLDFSMRIFRSNNSNFLARKSSVSAVTCIAQAYARRENDLTPLSTVLQLVESDIFGRLEKAVIQESRENCGKEAMVVLWSMSRAAQDPDDTELAGLELLQQQKLWSSTEGFGFQQKILNLIKVAIDINCFDDELILKACNVFKPGFQERNPGPFVFLPGFIIDFILALPPAHPRPDYVIRLGNSLVLANSSHGNPINHQVDSLLSFVCSKIKQLNNVRDNTDTSLASLEFLTGVLKAYADNLVRRSSNELQILMDFTLRCFECPEAYLRAGTADFWTSFIKFSGQTSNAQPMIDQIVLDVGPTLTKLLIDCFAGNASRSELDKLVLPFREIVYRQPQAKSWIESALLDTRFPSQRASEKDKRFFSQQVHMLRGSAKTKNVVREFWAICRGTPIGYG